MTKKKSNNLSKAFGITVARLRKKKGFTQESLAFETELTRTYISLIERGAASPTLNTISAISQTLGIDAEQLVGLSLKELQIQERARAGHPP